MVATLSQSKMLKFSLIDGQSWEYSYDELGQVISGVKKTAAGAAVSGQNYAYAYDTVGNRETATANAVETNYTANQLNQYTAIGSIIPTYDVNGNQLTGYNGWTMEWNGENRLKAIYNTTTRLEFAYDYNGRRFSKKTYAKSGADWVLSSEKKFIYDGFKQIAEYNGTTLAQAYVWQPAGSGDFDVPLWMKSGSNVYTYVTDGNKNIRQLKTAAGTVVATYDYDPFGNVSATGSVSNNPWQFSSEFRDAETGLIYYNYRYYAPSIGRWISRDPIWEEGGANLYNFVHNSVVTNFDVFGKHIQVDIPPRGFNPFRDTQTGRFRSFQDYLRQVENYKPAKGAGPLPENFHTRAFWAASIAQELLSIGVSYFYSFIGSKLINGFQKLAHVQEIKQQCASNTEGPQNGSIVRGSIDTIHTDASEKVFDHLTAAIQPGMPLNVKAKGHVKLIYFIDCQCQKYWYWGVPYTTITVTFDGISESRAQYDMNAATDRFEGNQKDVFYQCCKH